MDQVIIALDFSTFDEVKTFLSKFDEPLFVKVGMELFYQEGIQIIEYIKDLNHKIFLDLKLHDIPNTVERAMRGLRNIGVDMTNVHAAGGSEMMKAARRGLGEDRVLIAVTQLTSTSEEQMHKEQLINASLNESVINYARITYESGLDGVVCSPLEVEAIKKEISNNVLCVTPGVRPTGSSVGDQKRITTPGQARKNGSDYIVVGRPITQAEDPVDAYHRIVEEWEASYV